MSRNTAVSGYCVHKIIRQLKSLKFEDKETYFQLVGKKTVGFTRLPYLLDKNEKVSKKFTSFV